MKLLFSKIEMAEDERHHDILYEENFDESSVFPKDMERKRKNVKKGCIQTTKLT